MSRSWLTELGWWSRWSRIWTNLKRLCSLSGDYIFLKSYLLSFLKPNQGALTFFFLQATKALLPVKEKLGLVLAKMYNKHMQNMRALTFMQPRQDSMIKSEAVTLSQEDLSLVLVFFRSQIYCAQLFRELKVVACDLIFQQRIWALGKASLCAYLVRLPAKCPEIKWRSPGTTTACTAR